MTSQLRIRSFRPGQVSQWLSCGWRLWRRRPLEALRPAAVFALAVIVLRAIPVLGDIALLLWLPTVAASYALHVHLIALTGGAPRPRRAGGSSRLQQWQQVLRQALFGALAKRENIFPLVLVGLVLVVLGLIIHVLFNQVGGQAAVSPYGFFELTRPQMARLLLAYGAAALLWIVILALLLWTLPLFVLRDMVLAEAFGWNARAAARNVLAVTVLLLVLAAGLLPAALLGPWVPPVARLAAHWLALTLLAMLFGFSSYCGYRLVFADAEPVRPAVQPAPPSPRPYTPPGARRS